MAAEVRHLTTKPLVKIAPSRYYQVDGNPEPFFTISESLRNHLFNHSDNNVQNIGPMSGWEMDERAQKLVHLWSDKVRTPRWDPRNQGQSPC